MPRPTLSLCIPAYNAAAYLPRLLNSARTQTIPFDEILVYDDCSTDDTAAVAEQYGARVISGATNMGCSTGKNRLAEITTCDWIHFHDADDDLLPNFTAVAHARISEASAPDIILLNYEYLDYHSGALLSRPAYDRAMLHQDPILSAIQDKMVNFALIIRRSFLQMGGFDTDPSVLYNEDRAFYTRAAIAGLTFDFEPTLTCINYRYTSSMSASNMQKCARAAYFVWERVASQVDPKYYGAITRQLWRNATFAGCSKDWKTVSKCIQLARQLGSLQPEEEGQAFRFLAKLSPIAAYKIREYFIRLFKPHLRT